MVYKEEYRIATSKKQAESAWPTACPTFNTGESAKLWLQNNKEKLDPASKVYFVTQITNALHYELGEE